MWRRQAIVVNPEAATSLGPAITDATEHTAEPIPAVAPAFQYPLADQLTAVLDENDRLHAEVERLRLLLQQHGIEPDDGAVRSALILAALFVSANPDLSSGLMAGAEGRLALFVAAILASGYDNGPAAGPGGRGSTGPGVLLPGSQGRFSLVRVLAEARRCAATRR